MNYNYNYNHHHQQQPHSYDGVQYDPSQVQPPYDPSQIQPSYDQSYAYHQPYYAYNHQYPYVPDTHQQPHLQFQPEPSPVHPPGVNPAAAEPAPARPTHAPTGPSQYRGRGGRGGRPFRRGGRGRGRGHFNHGGPASSHGRGHGMGGGGHFPSYTSGPAISDVPVAPAGATSSVSGQITLPNPAQVPAASAQPVLRKLYCDICKAECNSPEIMEQHMNGKRHKKNMKVHEELQRRNNINGQQSAQIPTSQVNLADQPNKVQSSEKNECPAENMGSEITASNGKDELKLQTSVGESSGVPAEVPEGNTTDNSAARGRGLKRKMRGGKARRNVKNSTGQLLEPEQATTFVCELCNAKCESPAVYNSHMTGKKHLANLRRANGSQALPGASIVPHQPLPGVSGLQALYPSDVNALADAINTQVQQGDNDPQILLAQLLMTVLSQGQGQGQAPAIAPTEPLAGQIPGPSSEAGLSYEQQLAQTQVSDIAAHVEMENPTGETKNDLLSVSAELNALAGSSVTQIEGGSSETKSSPVYSGMTMADNSGATNDHIPS